MNNQFDDDSAIHRYQQNEIIDIADSLKLKSYINEDEIMFNKHPHSYCICIIRIVDYIQNVDKLTNPVELRKYYSLFFNTMASIIKLHE
ncbi:MAG TPA: hypothetical protein VGC75_01620, partial [Candidatus Nitrosocosmicus sp.]